MLPERVYAVLLRLYPAAFREEYEREMRAAFRRRWREELNALGRTLLWLSVITDTIVTSFEEHTSMLIQDLRYSLRSLRNDPSFTAAAVMTLALGIGAAITVYSLIYTVLIRPLPYSQPDRLVRIFETNPSLNIQFFSASVLNFLSWQERSKSFDALIAMGQGGANLTGDGEPQRANFVTVSAGFWPATGLTPVLGRGFSLDEDTPGRDRVVMLSEGLWQRRYGGDHAIIGHSILVDGEPRTVIGIAPQDVGFRSDVDLWMPLAPDPAQESRGNHVVTVLARLRPGVDQAQATAELNSVAEGLEREYPESNKGWRVRMSSIRDWIIGDQARTSLYVLLGATGLLLLAACSNVASLLVTRATGRERELSIRMALGAGRSRLLRQVTTESLVLAAIGGTLATLMAAGAIRWLAAVIPNQLPHSAGLTMDWPVVLFALGLTVGVGLLFGVAPAWLVKRQDLQMNLRQSGRGATTVGTAKLRLGLIGAQIATATVLMVGALLLIQSFARLQRVNLGFQPDHLLTARIRLPEAKYGEGDGAAVFFRTLLEQIDSIPGVVSAGVTSSAPLGLGNTSMPVVPVQRPGGVPERGIQALWRMATADYFRTLMLPVRRGRIFDSSDAGRGIVLSEGLARRLWPDGSDPIGRPVRLANGRIYTVVGIVGDARIVLLNEKPEGTMYFEPLSYLAGLTIVLRTQSNPGGFAQPLREAVRRLDPIQPLDNVRTMDQIIEQNTERPYLQAVLFAGFAVLAILLGAIGVAGVVAYTVERRMADLAIRLALGATPGHAMRMAASGGLIAAALGLVLGLAAAWGLARFLSTLLYEVRPDDLATFGAVGFALFAAAALASWLPARRVTRIDPVIALRVE